MKTIPVERVKALEAEIQRRIKELYSEGVMYDRKADGMLECLNLIEDMRKEENDG